MNKLKKKNVFRYRQACTLKQRILLYVGRDHAEAEEFQGIPFKYMQACTLKQHILLYVGRDHVEAEEFQGIPSLTTFTQLPTIAENEGCLLSMFIINLSDLATVADLH